MTTLGKIERVDDLRIIWPHEKNDFSKWLAKDENLALLSDAIGIDVILEELESSVGGFSVDLFAAESGTGRKIIIENQLEDTNHDHLGKIITYASGKEAEVIVWIVRRARDEHRQAVEWLNQHTVADIGFFLIEIELWKINDSLPAPKFNVVERPNDWAKTVKASEGLTDTKKLQLEFWQAFCNYAFTKPDFSKIFSKRKAQPQHWYDLSIGSAVYHITLSVNTQKKQLGSEIYISNNKDLFEKFKSNKDAIEQDFGMTMVWHTANKDCRIIAFKDGDIKKGDNVWPTQFDWLCETALKLRNIAKKYDI